VAGWSRIEYHEGAPRFRDNMRKRMEQGNFLGAWRSKILEQKRPALLVEVTATARHDLCYIPLRLDPGVNPIDRQSRHCTINDESDVDIDNQLGLKNLHEILKVRERFRDLVTIEIVAFPQSGILRSPGTAALLDAAIAEGADLLGGLDPVGIDGDLDGHLDAIFAIAERRGVGIDIHLHDGGEGGIAQIRAIAERTRAAGLNGKVAVSHAFALGSVPVELATRGFISPFGRSEDALK